MNKFVNVLIFICTIFLILNLTIMFMAVYNYSFNINDKSIIAGVIGFIGAVIGGSITLIGVNKTLLEGRRKEALESIPGKINTINRERDYILTLQLELVGMERRGATKKELADFVYRINTEMLARTSEYELLKTGKRLYDLYSRIIKITADLYWHWEYGAIGHYTPLITTTESFYEVCVEYSLYSNEHIEKLKNEYYELSN